jgi:hypothetical protein
MLKTDVHHTDLNRKKDTEQNQPPPFRSFRAHGNTAKPGPQCDANYRETKAKESGPHGGKCFETKFNGDRISAPQRMHRHSKDNGTQGQL